MAYFDDDGRPCIICHKTFLGCILSQPYEGDHPYVTDNLDYLEFLYEKKNPQPV